MTTPIAPIAPDVRTAHLPTTTLAELNAAAGLQTRVDRKYLLPASQAQVLVNRLKGARVLEIHGRRRFAYASTYFDTPDLDSYLLAARGRRRRFKVRTRTYLDSALCFLEVKTVGARGTTVKCRLEHQADDAHLTDQDRAFVADCLITSGVAAPDEAQELALTLSPVLSTTYERTTLLLPDRTRTTLDTTLTWRRLTRSSRRAPTAPTPAPAEPRRVSPSEPLTTGCAVVETKSLSGHSSTDRLLWAGGHRPRRISKYATGMALLHPALPANRWHRTMTHELAELTTAA
ncbi:polyphosphate polymerase domain-containing protein [Actinomyces slackii]|uniref:VTC domain n=1 Tax=Actinomyces slackii TaxID=52774 RepID=A0A3S4WIV9_9ACTO|nr:polyphosphate polymerase domain-containing protein [Actinomyces slackii]VEG73889.1 VTC domain [Actinomyces slackii]